jgi:TonB family protein
VRERTSGQRAGARRSDLLRGAGSGWLVSAALHGTLLWIVSSLVVQSAEPEPEETVTLLDLRPMLAAERPVGRTLDFLPDAAPVDREALPVFADEALVHLDANDAASRDAAIERMLALEELKSASHAAAPSAYGSRRDVDASGTRAGLSTVRLPRGPSRDGKAGARERGKPVTASAEGDGQGTSGAGLELPPQLVESPAPGYPAIARRTGLEGQVRCSLQVDERGVVIAVTVLHSSGSPILDEAARTGLFAWRFRPATRGGEPRVCMVEHVVTFRLVDARS